MSQMWNSKMKYSENLNKPNLQGRGTGWGLWAQEYYLELHIVLFTFWEVHCLSTTSIMDHQLFRQKLFLKYHFSGNTILYVLITEII